MKKSLIIKIVAPVLAVIIAAVCISVVIIKNNPDLSLNKISSDWPEIEVNSAQAGTAFSNVSEAPVFDGELSSLTLLKKHNPGLSFNVALNINDGVATALLPAGTDISALKLSFTYSGDSIKSEKTEVINGETPLDFTSPVTLTLNSGDESTKLTVYIMTLDTGLPSMSITLEDFADIDSKTEYSNCTVFAGGGDSSTNGDYAFPKNTTLNAAASIKGRGWTSWYMYPKKSYTLKFTEKQSLLGLPANKEWVLAANFPDRSLIRNAVTVQLAYAVNMEYVMDVRFVDLWVNGEYVGSYQLIEKIEVGESRVNITDFDESLSPEETGFILETNGHNTAYEFQNYTNGIDTDRPQSWEQLTDEFTYDPISGDIFYMSPYYDIIFNINKPSDGKLMKLSEEKRNEYLNYVYDYIDNLEFSLAQRNYEVASEYLDMESMAKWYIINEMTMNVDSQLHASCYMYKDGGGKLKMGPLWDFDLGFGNGQSANENRAGDTYLDNQKWFKELTQMPEFKAEVKKVWESSKEQISKINQFIDKTAEMMDRSQKINYTYWDITEYAQWSYEKTTSELTEYSEQIDYIKTFMENRISYMDNKILGW